MTLEARAIRLVLMLRQAGITETRVVSAIERVPRDIFVPETFRDQAYENIALPIGHGQTISQPVLVAFMTQALAVGDRMKVLEIGTGSGYQAAVLARLCRRVYTVERHRPLLAEAESRFAALRLHNVTTRCGDGNQGWAQQAPFERIIVTAAAPEVPTTLIEQLAIGGIMVIPVGQRREEQRLLRITRTDEGVVSEELRPAHFVPLVGAALGAGRVREPRSAG